MHLSCALLNIFWTSVCSRIIWLWSRCHVTSILWRKMRQDGLKGLPAPTHGDLNTSSLTPEPGHLTATLFSAAFCQCPSSSSSPRWDNSGSSFCQTQIQHKGLAGKKYFQKSVPASGSGAVCWNKGWISHHAPLTLLDTNDLQYFYLHPWSLSHLMYPSIINAALSTLRFISRHRNDYILEKYMKWQLMKL